MPEEDFEILKPEDKEQVQTEYERSKAEVRSLIETFKIKGYRQAAAYLENLATKMFTNIEIWLETGVITPKTTSLIERVFREIGRRVKKIAWGWSDKVATNLSKMILIRQYSRDNWEAFWKKKLGINNNFNISIEAVNIASL